MVNEIGCAGVAIGRGCQGRPWIFADIRNAFEGSDARVRPTLGEVGVVMRHARLLVEFFDGDERMEVHDLRKHIAWYLEGFPVGGSVRAAFMGVREPRRSAGDHRWIGPAGSTAGAHRG